MDKIYFNYLLPADFAVFLAYGVVFFLMLGVLMYFLRMKSKQVTFILAFFFALYHLIVILDFHFDFVPNLRDTEKYYFIFSKELPLDPMPIGLRAFLFISPVLSGLLLNNILAYISFQIFLFFMAVILIVKSWEILYEAPLKSTFRQFSLFFCLALPTSIFFVVAPLREAFTTFAFALSLYFLCKIFKKVRSINLGFPMSLLLVFFTRMQVILYFVMSLVGVKLTLDKNVARKILVSIVGLIMLGTFVFASNYKLSPDKLEYARNYRVENYTSTYGMVKWDTYLDILASAPKLMGQFLLAPFPILHKYNPMNMKLALIDACIVFFFLLVIILNLPSLIRQHPSWMLLILIYLFLFGIYEFSLGGAIRHRVPMVLMIAISVADRLSLFYAKNQLK